MLSGLATAPLRRARARVREVLDGISERVGALAAEPAAGRAGAMRAIVADLDACLRPHLDWEERTVHPVVDKFACEGPAAFSASMRYEHEIIQRSLTDLERRTGAGDAATFARHADRLLGVLFAHFELEEEVLFPILDRTMSPEAFRTAVGDGPAARRGAGGS
ncbi:hemerythrin domain-containing protein [Anaeromyxobacter oryzae]|uniref:Hemerythrin-like domain-containing protein n=1 Tax=Anaeromyxobacter oryzae TaxID=2918170 RepID=A0ABN6MR91_9BACT|nr:hemerythrin domain-containing protein [Anaeromyxobacter oryzae]BDG02986.1 hypothetical protein AMOR_19820 [Anaeromyxobacter oryzae]